MTVIADQAVAAAARPLVPRESIYWQETPRRRGWVAITFLLLLIYFGLISYAVFKDLKLSAIAPALRTGIVLGAFVLSVAPILYWWRQTWHFETWIQANPRGLAPEDLEFERKRFATNSEFARAFWSALVVIFTGLLVTFRS